MTDRPLLFGVATSDHQSEAYEPRWEDVRDRCEREMRLVARGAATDFWNRYAEDLGLARALGCTAFRFSVAWARVEPAPGVFEPAALDHYAALIECAVAAGTYGSITSNREWGLPLGPGTDFGLYHVDLDHDPELRRVPTEAAATFRALIEEGCR